MFQALGCSSGSNVAESRKLSDVLVKKTRHGGKHIVYYNLCFRKVYVSVGGWIF